jgi:hypothetical protein
MMVVAERALQAIWQDGGGYPCSLGEETDACPLPAGFPAWDDYYRDLGIPEEDLGVGADRISDPQGHGPGIWFQVVPDAKAVKNRLHLDIHARASGRTRSRLAGSESTPRPAGWPAWAPPLLASCTRKGSTTMRWR